MRCGRVLSSALRPDILKNENLKFHAAVDNICLSKLNRVETNKNRSKLGAD